MFYLKTYRHKIEKLETLPYFQELYLKRSTATRYIHIAYIQPLYILQLLHYEVLTIVRRGGGV